MKGSAIRHLAAAGSARRIAAALFEHTIQIWDLHSGEQVQQFESVLSFGGRRLAMSPTGERCVAAAWAKGKRGGVACYDATTGSVLWHRTDIRQTRRVRFAPSGEVVWCGVDEDGCVHELSAASGATLQRYRGLEDVIPSAYSKHLLLCAGELVVTGGKEFCIPRLTFGLLDAVFSPDAVCVSEAGGPVRCFDCFTGEERWRYDPLGSMHVLTMAHRIADGHFYGVEWGTSGTSRILVRFSDVTGRREEVCSLIRSCEEEFCDAGNVVVTSAGEVKEVAGGETIQRLAFPERENADRQ